MALPRTLTYRGHDLLLRPPEPVRATRDGLTLPSLDIRAPGGWFSARTAVEPRASRAIELVFHLATRAELAELRAFLDAREGRRHGFWLPSPSVDAEVSAGSVLTGLTFRAWGYPALFDAHAAAYRHWITYGPGASTYRWWRMVAATDHGDGTETAGVGFGGGTGGTTPASGLTTAAGYRSALLQFARLAADTVEIEYLGPRASRVVVPVVTIPQETP